MSLRQLALSDPNSSYYQNINAIIARGMADAENIARSRKRVMIPFKVPAASVARYEQIFGWKIVVENHGVRTALPADVAGLAYCMSLRNLFALGADGQEVIAVDADLPVVVAKGAAYVKVVRTSLTTRLVAGYTLEGLQLERLAESSNVGVKVAAADVLQELVAGGGRRVYLSPLDSGIVGDVVLIDHVRTSMSLLQVVACATAWKATMVRGVCFFQPEMLVSDTGATAAFPGEYVINHDRDLITYVPDEDPEACFSHSWSALRSFFLNHECVYEGKTWLVEKHLGENGIFHYVANRAEEPWQFPAEVGANYYSHDLTEWVRLEYPTRGGVLDGTAPVYWRRESVKLLKTLYDKTMAVLLSVDPKRLTRAEVIGILRAFNNTAIVGGDTVRRPQRMYVGDLEKAATPMLAQAVHRRAAASAECGKVLSEIRRRYNVAGEGVLSLFWEVCCASMDYVKDVSIVTALSSGATDLTSLVDGFVDMSVLAKGVPSTIEVTQVVGSGAVRDCGELLPGMPGRKPAYLADLLHRARRFAKEGASMFVTRERVEDVSSTCCDSDGGVDIVDSDKRDSGVGFGVGETVVSHETFEYMDPKVRAGVAGRLFDKLVAEQDAADFLRPPRVVDRYECVTEAMGIAPTPHFGVAQMQEDYDDGFAGLSTVDFEILPHIASNEDTEVVRDAHMAINDSKREIAEPKYVRRAMGRAAGTGVLPRTQVGLQSAIGKRNIDVPTNRELVDFDKAPGEAVDKVIEVCYVENWKEKLNAALATGLWQPNEDDLANYVPKVDTAKAEAMLKEFFSLADVDMTKWLVMTKGKAKPPLDPGADMKVPLPQTIMYNESKGMNAMYSSIMSRFHDEVESFMLPHVKFNDRSSPAEHEKWFNSLQPLRATAKRVYKWQGDSFVFDRSQELMAFTAELLFYRRHGLDEETLNMWKQTMGVKTAVSLMHGIILYIILQGLSGIFKTLFRNGLLTLIAVVDAVKLKRGQIISLDIKGDDYALETNVPIDVALAVQVFAWKYNLSAKLWGCDYLYFCSKYWVHVDNWWYWVADPERKYESICSAVAVNDKGDTVLAEKWVSLGDDLRHYNNGLVAYELAEAVKATNTRRTRAPIMLIGGLAALAEFKDRFFAFYGPNELVGL